MGFDRLHAEIKDLAHGLVGVSFRDQLNDALSREDSDSSDLSFLFNW